MNEEKKEIEKQFIDIELLFLVAMDALILWQDELDLYWRGLGAHKIEAIRDGIARAEKIIGKIQLMQKNK